MLYNPIIRYIIVNLLKLTLASLLALKAEDKTSEDIATSVAVLSIIGLAPITFVYVLKRDHHKLKDTSVEKMIGTLYEGKYVKGKNHATHQFIVMFFVRRIIFACFTVYLHDSP